MKTVVRRHDSRVAEAFRRSPEVMTRNLGGKLERAALEVSREMRRAAPKAFSNLVNSILVARKAPLHFRVSPGVAHGLWVETGREPGKVPGMDKGLMEWVRFRTGLTGAPLDRATFAIARAIGRRGIKPQPYVAPTAERMAGRAVALADEGIEDGIKEAFGQ